MATQRLNKCKGCKQGGSNNQHESGLCCLRCRNFSEADAQALRWPREELLAEINTKLATHKPEELANSEVKDAAKRNIAVMCIVGNLVTKVDKARALFTWMSKNIVWDKQFDKNLTAVVVLETGRCVCRGFAMTYMQLAWEAGINCEFIGGRSKTPTFSSPDPPTFDLEHVGDHAWNVIDLEDGTLKLVDPTWGSNGEIGMPNPDAINYDCFTMSNEDFLTRHFPSSDQLFDFKLVPKGGSAPLRSYLAKIADHEAQANYPQWLSAPDPANIFNSASIDMIEASSLRPSAKIIRPQSIQVIANTASLTKFSMAGDLSTPVYGIVPPTSTSVDSLKERNVNVAYFSITRACTHLLTYPSFVLKTNDKKTVIVPLSQPNNTQTICVCTDDLLVEPRWDKDVIRKSVYLYGQVWNSNTQVSNVIRVVEWELRPPATST